MNVDEFVGQQVVAMGLATFQPRGRARVTTPERMQAADGSTVRVSRRVVVINNGRVIGDDNDVVGNNNRIEGARCRATGTGNTVTDPTNTTYSAAMTFGRTGRFDLSTLERPQQFGRPLAGVRGAVMLMHDAGEASDQDDEVNPATGRIKKTKKSTKKDGKASKKEKSPSSSKKKRSASPSAKKSQAKRRGNK